MIKNCRYKNDCSFIKQGKDWCNVVPIWYQTTDETIVAPTLKSLKEKILKKKYVGQVEKCTLIIPVKHGNVDGCKYEATIFTLDNIN